MAALRIIVSILGLTILCLPAKANITYDLSTDFTIEKNPDKVWQFGYSATNSLATDQFRLDKDAGTVDSAEAAGVIEMWHPSKNNGPGEGYYPYIAYNSSKKSQFVFKGVSFKPGQIAMEASNTGQYGLVRFVAPTAGNYRVSAKFEGVHIGPSTTDVHVLHNDTSLFDADIDGYGGDPAFHPIQGASPAADYSGEVAMKAGDTLTFAIGYGKNKTHYGDTTGLFAKVTLLDKAK
jgi:hypothetical protein